MRLAALLVAVVMFTAASTSVAVAGGTSQANVEIASPVSSNVPPADPGDSPPDPDEDRLGWEDGYWYNESLSIDLSGGLNEDDLDALVARTMARVEVVRELEFERHVPVEIQNRSAFRESENGTVPTSLGIFDNAKYEALFLVNRSTNSIAVQEENAGGSVLGYYDPDRESIVLVVEDGADPRIDEYTLAHELVHALQDDYFELERLDARTRDVRNAQDGLIEGDAGYVEHLYKNRCSDQWECVTSQRDAGVELANLGVYFAKYVPYSDGPVFVRHVEERHGWAGVNALYEDPPTSSEQIIHPEKYGEDEPTRLPPIDVTITGGTDATPRPGTETPGPNATDTASTNTTTPVPTPSPDAERSNASTPVGNGTTPIGNGSSLANESTPTGGTASQTPINGTGTPNATASGAANRTTTAVDERAEQTQTDERETPAATASDRNRRTPTANETISGTTTAGTPPETANRSTPTVPRTMDTRTATRPGDERWYRVRPPGRPDYATLGEGAIASMFFYPTQHSGGQTEIVSSEEFYNRDRSSGLDPYDYDQPYSAGWDGDRLQVYRNEVGETAYVWRIAWDTPADAREFTRGYRRLLGYWGGEQIEESVYRIPDGGFQGAYHVEVSETSVTIVNVPTVSQLSTLYDEVEGVDRNSSAELTVDGELGLVASDSKTSTRQPGFGPVVAIIGLAIAVLLARRSG